MAKCVNCGAYTKFENGLCSKCYNEKKKAENPNSNINLIIDNNPKLGLSDKNRDY